MVVNHSMRNCLLCSRAFEGRTFLCRECSDRYRGQPVPLEVRKQFYEALDYTYPERSNTYDAYNEPVELLRAINRLPRHVRVLEIGAGGGFLGRALADMGFSDLTLSDFTVTTLQEIRQRVPEAMLVAADAGRPPFRDASFDVVISSDLIEHLPDVDEHLHHVARILAPGGLYLLKTPNRIVADTYYRLADLHDSYFWHPSMFSPAELRAALDRHGLQAHILPQPHLTDAQLAKLPKRFGELARKMPLGFLPETVRPHLEVVGRKRG